MRYIYEVPSGQTPEGRELENGVSVVLLSIVFLQPNGALPRLLRENKGAQEPGLRSRVDWNHPYCR